VLLEKAKKFHENIVNTYHDQSYAHYCADSSGLAWHKVTWRIDADVDLDDVENLVISNDDEKGNLLLKIPVPKNKTKSSAIVFNACLLEAMDPGDQTVPAFSADAQLRSGRFKGVFRQTGYEHQGSYKDQNALASTIYSLLKIISSMKWSNS